MATTDVKADVDHDYIEQYGEHQYLSRLEQAVTEPASRAHASSYEFFMAILTEYVTEYVAEEVNLDVGVRTGRDAGSGGGEEASRCSRSRGTSRRLRKACCLASRTRDRDSGPQRGKLALSD